MANTPTTYYGLNKPAIGDSGWGATLNADLDGIDTAIHLVSAAVATINTSLATAQADILLKAPIASPNLTGTVTITAPAKIQVGQIGYLRTDRGSISSAQSFDMSTAYHRLTTSGNITASLVTTNLPATGYVIGMLIDVTMGGAHTITWPAAVKWANGTAPSLGSSGRHLIALITYDLGVTVLGTYNTSYA